MGFDFQDKPRGPRHKYVGMCIYCGATDNLSDEHALPESLDGDLVLDDASCLKCSKITGLFEGRYTGETLKPARTVLGMKTKRKKQIPKSFPIEIVRNGISSLHNLSVEEFMAVIPMWEIGPCGKYSMMSHAKGLKHGEVRLIVFNTRSDGEVALLKEKFGADEIKVHFKLYIEEFFRMLAKIAYCFAIDKYGLNNLVEVFVLPAVLKKSKDIYQWVGGDGNQELYDLGRCIKADHVIVAGSRNGEVHVRIKFFKDRLTPEYRVVVGRLSENLRGVYESIGFKGA